MSAEEAAACYAVIDQLAAMAKAAPLAEGTGYGAPAEAQRVRVLQRKLRQLGWAPGRVDGLFGPRTEAAVLRFQAASGLVVDGAAGPQVWKALARARKQPLRRGAGYAATNGSQRVRALQRRLHPAAAVVAADDDVPHLQNVHGVLHDRQAVEVRVDDDVGDVAVDEHLARREVNQLRRGHARVRAPDPQVLRRLLPRRRIPRPSPPNSKQENGMTLRSLAANSPSRRASLTASSP